MITEYLQTYGVYMRERFQKQCIRQSILFGLSGRKSLTASEMRVYTNL
jgi:hypothetical protein